MKNRMIFSLGASVVLLGVSGCEKKVTPTVNGPAIELPAGSAPISKTDTLETRTLSASISEFIAAPSVERDAAVQRAFVALDREIAELQTYATTRTGQEAAEAKAKMGNLALFREQEALRFGTARAGAALPATAEVALDTRTGAEKLESNLNRAGEKIESGAEKVGESLKKAGENVGEAIDRAAN